MRSIKFMKFYQKKIEVPTCNKKKIETPVTARTRQYTVCVFYLFHDINISNTSPNAFYNRISLIRIPSFYVHTHTLRRKLYILTSGNMYCSLIDLCSSVASGTSKYLTIAQYCTRSIKTAPIMQDIKHSRKTLVRSILIQANSIQTQRRRKTHGKDTQLIEIQRDAFDVWLQV